jgi:tetratricopeptide (TPR) repeat protein
MQTDDSLATLIKKKDSLNILRFIRVHGLRKPELVVEHGKALLGPDLLKTGTCDELSRLAALEQICLAALDIGETTLAEMCLDRLKTTGGIARDSIRFRRLLARCLEAAGDMGGAELIYKDLLTENPANCIARQRLYCIYRAQVGKEVEAATAMNEYLQHNPSDVGAWYELAKLRLEIGDVKGAIFCYEEILLETPADASMQCALAECFATLAQSTTGKSSSTLEYLKLARQHFSQAVELDPSSRRAQWGLLTAANNCLVYNASTSNKKDNDPLDEHDGLVAEALVKFAAEKLLASYKGTPMFAVVKKTVAEYTSA